MPPSLLLVEFHSQEARVFFLLIPESRGGPKVSPLGSTRGLSSSCSSRASFKLFAVPGLELHLKLGLEQPILPMDVEEEPVRVKLSW